MLEARRTAATELGGEPPAPRSAALRPACRALPPPRLAGRQAGHRALALPPARSGHASSAASANPPLAPVRLPPRHPINALSSQSTSELRYPLFELHRLASLSSNPLRPWEASHPPPPIWVPPPELRPPAAPARPRDLLLLGPQPKQIPLRRTSAPVNDFRDFPHPALPAPQAVPAPCSSLAAHQATGRGGKPGCWMLLAGSCV